jgi:hypothetical protein
MNAGVTGALNGGSWLWLAGSAGAARLKSAWPATLEAAIAGAARCLSGAGR